MTGLLPLLLGLLGCVPGSPEDSDDEACTPRADLPAVGDLPRSPSWVSDERTYGTGLGWGDVNGDGWMDLVVASGNDMVPGPVSVHLGNAEGVLHTAPDWNSDADAYHGHLALGDVDGDGHVDIAVSRYLGLGGFGDPGGVDLYYGSATIPGSYPDWSVDGFHTFSLAFGDADGDGDLDLAVAVGEPYEGIPAPDRLYENVAGSLGTGPVWTSEAAFSLDVAFVDAEGDGDLDLVFAREGAPHARYDNADGYPGLPDWEAEGMVFGGNSLDFGDVDGDGLPDLLVSDTGLGIATLYCGPAWPSCWVRAGDPVYASAVSLVDVDGDEDLDAVLGAWWGRVEVWSNQEGVLDDAVSYRSAADGVIEAFAWHDLDGLHEEPGCMAGTGLVAIPRGARVVELDPPDAVIGDGYVTAPAGVEVDVRWARSRQLDLAVSNWAPEDGTWVFERE
jgi:hypothetical protein